MTGHRPLQSPVLVGRDDLLALAERRLAAAAAGQGHLLFVAGEAGIGKTRLLAAVAEAARRRSFGVVRAAAGAGRGRRRPAPAAAAAGPGPGR